MKNVLGSPSDLQTWNEKDLLMSVVMQQLVKFFEHCSEIDVILKNIRIPNYLTCFGSAVIINYQ